MINLLNVNKREKEIKVSSESQEQNLRGELPGPAGLVSRRRACPSPQAPPCQKPRSPGWRKGRAADITSAGPGIGTRHHRVQAARWACSPSPAVASGRRAGARPGGRVGPRAPSVTRHVRRGWGRCWPTFRPAGCSSRQPGPLAPPLPSAAPDGSGGPAGCSGRSGGLSRWVPGGREAERRGDGGARRLVGAPRGGTRPPRPGGPGAGAARGGVVCRGGRWAGNGWARAQALGPPPPRTLRAPAPRPARSGVGPGPRLGREGPGPGCSPPPTPAAGPRTAPWGAGSGPPRCR